MSFDETIFLTAEWYKNFYNKREVISIDQIRNYFKRL